VRTCVVCRATRDEGMLRFARRDGHWYAGRGEGRGAWVDAQCVTGLTDRMMGRAFRQAVDEEEVRTVRDLLERVS
jgi:predicted RNA-binding protein YlxR (DUF448 family)